MYVSDRERWDTRYVTPKPEKRTTPTPFVTACLPRLPRSGLALDVAAGAGRHSVALAAHGLQVHALDVSWQGLRKAVQLARCHGVAERFHPVVFDLKRGWLPGREYDVVVNNFFLERSLAPLFVQALKPGGWLIFETMTIAQMQITPDRFRNYEDHLLQPGELRTLFPGLTVFEYWEGTDDNKATARLLARKPPSA